VKLSRLKKWFILISSFIAGQGSVQALNLISGFLLLRWLSVEAYAQYSVTFGFQSTLAQMIDLGFSGSITALVGVRGSNKELMGSYIRSAKHFRNKLFAFIIPIAAIAFPLVTARHRWDWTTQLLLFASIVISLLFQGWVAYYSSPLLIHQRIKQYYQPQIIGAAARIVLCFILYLTTALSSWTTAWVNSAIAVMSGFLYRQNATPLVTEPKNSVSKFNSEMLSYLAPIIPGIFFTAIQGQISVLLITLFGQTKSIAEVAALGRLSQLFIILTTSNYVIIEPYIAKVDRQHLVKRYFQILGVAVAISLVLCATAFLFPQPILWILGPKYQNLQAEVGWTVVASCLSYLGTVMWAMHTARKWVYWWYTSLHIMLLLIVQIVSVAVMDLSTTLNVIYFSIITASTIILVHIIAGINGLINVAKVEQ
jgi:O-antigen/teichoic acid export membrane protein